MIKNRFYILKGCERRQLSETSYNVENGDFSHYSQGTYGYPIEAYLDKDNRPNNINYKPIFILPSSVSFTKCEILMFDKNNKYIKNITITSGDNLIELDISAYSIGVNITTQDKYDEIKTWFYVGYEVNPHYRKLEISNTKEKEQMFFRKSLSGAITLHGDDYRYVKSANLEQGLMFAIYNSKNKLISKNIFNKTDCIFDDVLLKVSLKLFPDDKYSKILDKYEDKYDIIKLSPAISKITITKRMAFQFYTAGANNITTVANNTYWEDDVNEPVINPNLLVNKYHFAKIKSFYEIHLNGFNYRAVNSTYEEDENSNTWKAATKDTLGDSSYIHFEKEISEGAWLDEDVDGYYLYNDSKLSVTDPDDIDNPNRYRVKYDLYRIYITYLDNVTNKHVNIYKSERLYIKFKNKFLIESGAHKMVKHEKLYGITPTPEEFNLGDNIITYDIYYRIVCGLNSNSVNINDTQHNLFDLPYDDFAYNRANYKKCISSISVDDLPISLHSSPATKTEPTKYGIDDYGKYFTSNFLGIYSMVFGKPIPISRSAWANISTWVTLSYNFTNFESLFRKEIIIKNAYNIADVISVMLSEIDPSITHKNTPEYSNFLYSDTSPLENDSMRNNSDIFITPKSNILKANYDQAAQKAEITFKQLMDMLKNCFKCYWFIDEQNRFRIEHVSYFLNGFSYLGAESQFDMRSYYDKFNKKNAIYCQYEVEYEKQNLASKYEFNWMDDCTDLFGNNTIEIDSLYTQNTLTESIDVNEFSSDIDLMLCAPDKFSSDGFALLVADSDSKRVNINSYIFKDSEYTYNYSALSQNFVASWLYLIKYYMYDMPSINIKCNGIPEMDSMQVQSIKKIMKQEIEFIVNSEDDINLNELITTDLGDGYIESMAIDIDTHKAKIELLYEPE